VNRLLLLLGSIALLAPATSAADGIATCPERKNEAVAKYHRCIADANQRSEEKQARRMDKCLKRFTRAVRRAEFREGCAGDVTTEALATSTRNFSEAILEAGDGQGGAPDIVVTQCDLEQVDLLEFEAWQRENGYWVGEYSFYGPDGAPNESTSWPYRYDAYRGFIHLSVEGNCIRQRNVFLYPPQFPEQCTGAEDEVKGNGTCGVNGNEKIYSADQCASDCFGGLAGLFVTPFGNADTSTTILGEDRVLYQVNFASAPFEGNLMQSQLTTLPGNETRVRTAQGFNVVTSESSYASYYRETKFSSEQFFEQLEATRAAYNILPEDECSWDGVTNEPSNTDCETHFNN
jgi:hypothetical protein